MKFQHSPTLIALAASLMLVACGGGDDDPVATPEETREQDNRTAFAPADPTATTFDALAAAAGDTVDNTTTSRWAGVLNGAAYRVEVPENWNGKLVMYAHGYAGEGDTLGVNNPSIRRYLIQNNYAWAASSYSKNFYDVRVGVEDTNALALEFNAIAAANSRPLDTPEKIYITGHSMGGHITAAAIEEETFATANHKVRYDGAVPMCGVTGDTELFDYFSAYQASAQALAGLPKYPLTGWADISATVRSALFTTFTTVPTAQGAKLAEVVKNLTGGERPIFAQGFGNSGLQNVVWGTFGGDGTINGILNKSSLDTRNVVLQLDNDPALSADETALNEAILRSTPADDANRLRTDGLRWIPKVNGEFSIPVVSLHTLGDMYVPFSMTQIHRRRAEANGNGDWLVQRAIRAPSHCDFTYAEQVDAFADMVAWAEQGAAAKPAGDDVLTPAVVADANYGCKFTINAASPGEPTGMLPSGLPSAVLVRTAMPACQ